MQPSPGQIIAVWFSCGAASAVAAKLTLLKYPHCDVRVVNNPVEEEDKDNRRFLADVQDWLGVTIQEARNSKYPLASCDDVWRRRKAMVFPNGAPCTFHLKKEARQQWEVLHKPHWHVLGFTADEQRRHNRFVLTERDNVLPILIDAGIDKPECAEILLKAGLRLPAMYARGYPNANCIGCIKVQSPTYWNHVRKVDPEVFAKRAEQSRTVGKTPVRLVRYKGKLISLDELPADAIGRPMATMRSVECGIFCEEKPR